MNVISQRNTFSGFFYDEMRCEFPRRLRARLIHDLSFVFISRLRFVSSETACFYNVTSLYFMMQPAATHTQL